MSPQGIDADFWRGRRVAITGHQGFKGAWLVALMARLGATTLGYGLDRRSPLLYNELSLPDHQHVEGDVRDFERLSQSLKEFFPSVVLHLAAQPIVLNSYADPLETFSSNVMGTATFLNALRGIASVDAAVVITSDKVYENKEWAWAYRETDRLGGGDPYSASKAAAEIVTSSMARSFFKDGDTRIATARAGNVIGGGDWGEHRLLPDAARSFSTGQDLIARRPDAIRPWQHVLEPLSGYMTLAQHLTQAASAEPTAWNFGPSVEDALPVREVLDRFVNAWRGDARWRSGGDGALHKEANVLAVDSSLARQQLRWRPRWAVDEAIARTACWYRAYLCEGSSAASLVDGDISDYLSEG